MRETSVCLEFSYTIFPWRTDKTNQSNFLWQTKTVEFGNDCERFICVYMRLRYVSTHTDFLKWILLFALYMWHERAFHRKWIKICLIFFSQKWKFLCYHMWFACLIFLWNRESRTVSLVWWLATIPMMVFETRWSLRSFSTQAVVCSMIHLLTSCGSCRHETLTGSDP